MRELVIGLLLAGTGAIVAKSDSVPFASPIPSKRSLAESGIAAEYWHPIDAAGVGPEWTARVEVGFVRISVEQQPEKRIALLTPTRCSVVGCEGVMIEQAVAHRHHGVSIIKEPCRIFGSDRTYPYRVSVSVLRSPQDTEGVNYKGCGWPAAL